MKKCGGGRGGYEFFILSLASGNSRDRVKSHHVSAPSRGSRFNLMDLKLRFRFLKQLAIFSNSPRIVLSQVCTFMTCLIS